MQTIEIDLPDYSVGPGSLITASSYLIDRFVPACAHIELPEKTVVGGRLSLRQTETSLSGLPVKGFKKLKSFSKPKHMTCDRVMFDFRLRSPQNWAHFLNNHLPIFFKACEVLDLEWDHTCLILPGDIPGHIRNVADIFGLYILATDNVVTGEAVIFEADPWTGIRPARAHWVEHPRVDACLNALPKDENLPSRVFLSRKTTRTLSNAAEVEAYLGKHGFVTIYPEELTASEQMRLFQEAETIVAIHGAALAPLLYHRPHHALRRLIELLPCGHMTDVYRVMAHQVGCDWIGIRGRLKAEYVEPAYRLGAGFSQYSLDSFHVDLLSLDEAFSLCGEL